MSLHLVTPPPIEPVSLDDLRKQLRITDNLEDKLLTRLIRATRIRCERATRRTLISQTWDWFLDEWPVSDGAIPKPPLRSVTYVKYTDSASAVQTWSSTLYLVDAPTGEYCARGRLTLGYQQEWPIVRPTANAIQVRFIAGYGDKMEDVPELLAQGMLMDAVRLYEHRSAILSGNRAMAIDVPGASRDIYLSFRSL